VDNVLHTHLHVKCIYTEHAVYEVAAVTDGHKTVRFTMVLPVELDEAILEWRRKQPDLPDRNTAIARMIRKVLDEKDEDEQPNYS
jgi:hypothetical protein